MQTVAEKNNLPAEQTGNVPVTLGADKGYLAFKRVFDIAAALAAGAVLLLPLILVGILIRLDSPGPAIFRQERMGKDGKAFTIYKFRTMSMSAPRDMATRELEKHGQYVTKLGAFLRRSSIDELPQLWNILKGDMSIVGYRPVVLTEARLNEMRKQYGVFTTRPGITGLAQVSGRDNLSIEEKVRLDAEYVAKCSMKMDIHCILMTVKTVITGEGVN